LEQTLSALLARIGWAAFLIALGGLLLVNGTAIALWIWRKDRDLVQRWVAPWLAMNVLLVLIGVGVPAVTSAARLVVLTATDMAPLHIFGRSVSSMGAIPADSGVGSAD
jgi:uncharacterized iron-regulated membrane protein